MPNAVKEAVVMIFYNHATRQVLLETRTPPSKFSGIPMLPAETVEEPEDHVDALFRGCREEFGIIPETVIPIEKLVTGESGYQLFPFVILSWTGTIPSHVLDNDHPLSWANPNSLLNHHPLPSTMALARIFTDWLATLG